VTKSRALLVLFTINTVFHSQKELRHQESPSFEKHIDIDIKELFNG
jgi:hypothetical protein